MLRHQLYNVMLHMSKFVPVLANLQRDLVLIWAETLSCNLFFSMLHHNKWKLSCWGDFVYSLDNHSRSKKHLENVSQLQLEMAADDELLAAANDETDLLNEEATGSAEENLDINTSRSK